MHCQVQKDNLEVLVLQDINFIFFLVLVKMSFVGVDESK